MAATENTQDISSLPEVRIRSISSSTGLWFIAADVCSALGISMRALSKLPPGMRGKGLNEERHQMATVDTNGVLWLIMAAGTRESLAPTERIPYETLTVEGQYTTALAHWEQGVRRGLMEAVAATRKVTGEWKEARRVEGEALVLASQEEYRLEQEALKGAQ